MNATLQHEVTSRIDTLVLSLRSEGVPYQCISECMDEYSEIMKEQDETTQVTD